MAEDEPAAASSATAAAWRRARLRSVRAALRIIFALLFLAALAGFGLGMWREVAASPSKHAAANMRGGKTLLEKWAVVASAKILDLQHFERPHAPAPEPQPGLPEPPATALRPAPAPNPIPPVAPNAAPPAPNELLPPEPQLDVPEPDVALPEEPKPAEPPPHEPEPPLPVPQTPKLPVQPAPPKPVIEEVPAPEYPGVDAATVELLRKADAEYRIAVKYNDLAQPTAPQRGRDAARDNAIKHLSLARDLYQAALKRKLPGNLKTSIEERHREVQQMLYWANKFRTMH